MKYYQNLPILFLTLLLLSSCNERTESQPSMVEEEKESQPSMVEEEKESQPSMVEEEKESQPLKVEEEKITVYLKTKDGGNIKVSDCEISVIDRNTLLQILKLRNELKESYPFDVLSDEQTAQLKAQSYKGPTHPKEIDDSDMWFTDVASALDTTADELQSSVFTHRLVNTADVVISTGAKLLREWERKKKDWPPLSLDEVALTLILYKLNEPSSDAAEVGDRAITLIGEHAVDTVRTNIEGQATIRCPKDCFLWLSCYIDNTFISWIVAVDSIENSEINQSSAFILERIPSSVGELRRDIAVMHFFHSPTPFSESTAQRASIVSDDFYMAAKQALSEQLTKN